MLPVSFAWYENDLTIIFSAKWEYQMYFTMLGLYDSYLKVKIEYQTIPNSCRINADRKLGTKIYSFFKLIYSYHFIVFFKNSNAVFE